MYIHVQTSMSREHSLAYLQIPYSRLLAAFPRYHVVCLSSKWHSLKDWAAVGASSDSMEFAEVCYMYTAPTLHCLALSSLPFFSFAIIAHLAPPIMRLRRSSVFRPHVIGKGLGLLITMRIYITSQISHALFPR